MYTAIISLNSVKKLMGVMVKCGVLFEVRTEFLNNIWVNVMKIYQLVQKLLVEDTDRHTC
jgi:hypothetical protein